MKTVIILCVAAIMVLNISSYIQECKGDDHLTNHPASLNQLDRFRRFADSQNRNRGSINVEVNKPMSGPERRPSINVDYQHKIYENKHGHISAGGGISKYPGQKPSSHVGIQGTFRFKRDADNNFENHLV